MILNTPTQQATQAASAQEAKEEEGIPNALKEPMAPAVPWISVCHASAEEKNWKFQESAAANQKTHVAYNPKLPVAYDPSLSAAVNFGQLSQTRTLLEQKADPNSVLDLAVHRRKQAFVELLLEYKANPATVTTSSRHLTTPEIKALLDATPRQSNATKELCKTRESVDHVRKEFYSFKTCIENLACEKDPQHTFIPCSLDRVEESPEYWDDPRPRLDRIRDVIDLEDTKKI